MPSDRDPYDEGQHPGLRKAYQTEIMSSLCVALESCIAAPAAPDEGNAAVLGDPSVIHEVAAFIKEVQEGTRSQEIGLPDTFDKFVRQLKGILERNPAPPVEVAESIRSILIMVDMPRIMLDMPLWFVGSMSAAEAEKMLRDKVNGSFMVRDSQTAPGTHNITVRYDDLIYHFRIKREAGELYLKSGHPFTAMADLIRWLSTPKEIGGYTVRLAFPAFAYASNPWYHGSISEDEAVAKLESKPGGAYLVRRSLLGSGGLALSLRVDVGSDSAIVHYCIVAFDDGTFGLNSHPNKQTFNTVEKLIAFYAKTGTRLHRQVLNGSQSVPTPPLSVSTPPPECKATPVKADATPAEAVCEAFGTRGVFLRALFKYEAVKARKNSTLSAWSRSNSAATSGAV